MVYVKYRTPPRVNYFPAFRVFDVIFLFSFELNFREAFSIFKDRSFCQGRPFLLFIKKKGRDWCKTQGYVISFFIR